MNFIPYRVRYGVRCSLSRALLPLAMRWLCASTVPSHNCIATLRFAWNNDSFINYSDWLWALVDYARKARGPILECGSGVSTILLAALARQGLQIWSLEHSTEWVERVAAVLARYGLEHRVRLLYAPLISYGAYHWYRIPAEFPDRFDLVACDGPPAVTTPGGRYGLLPVLHERLAGARILLDDTERAEEAEAITRWREEFGVQVLRSGKYSILKA